MAYKVKASLLFNPLPSAEEMNLWDKSAIEDYGIPEFTLMENASREAFSLLEKLGSKADNFLIIAGGGNNGGDGITLAYYLNDSGYNTQVLHTKNLKSYSKTSRQHIKIAQKTGVEFASVPKDLFSFALNWASENTQVSSDNSSPKLIIIDALLGTGFKGNLRDKELIIIQDIVKLKRFSTIVSIDIPSGLNALSGLPQPEAVEAHHTLALENAKPGLILPESRKYVGILDVKKIGIPERVKINIPASYQLLNPSPDIWEPDLYNLHKGQAGRVLIIGGSKGMYGAPILSGYGAIRSGAGLVRLACLEHFSYALHSSNPEFMTLPLSSSSKTQDLTEKNISEIILATSKQDLKTCLVLGPGLGSSSLSEKLVLQLLSLKKRPSIVLDADGLNVLIENPKSRLDNLRLLREDDCITPHPGEAAKLLNISNKEVQVNRFLALENLCKLCKATVILKGAGTLIGKSGKPIVISPFSLPALAIGGSGDVLSGIVASLISFLKNSGKDDENFHAACLAVFIHAKAGEYLGQKYPIRGITAKDIANAIPESLKCYFNNPGMLINKSL